MLGMMNCPTENIEFYASSPSVVRQLTLSSGGDGSGQNSPKSLKGENGEQQKQQQQQFGSSLDSNDGLLLEVFGESKRKPQITYTENGRRLVNGKLEDNEQPDKLWTRLIVDSVTSTKLRRTSSNGSGDSGDDDNDRAEEQKRQLQAEEEEKEAGEVSSNGKQKLRQRFSLGALFAKRTKSTGTMDGTIAAALRSLPPSLPPFVTQQKAMKKLQRQPNLGTTGNGVRQITCIAVNGNNNGSSSSNTVTKKLSV